MSFKKKNSLYHVNAQKNFNNIHQAVIRVSIINSCKENKKNVDERMASKKIKSVYWKCTEYI